jgi:hypothetical protein
MNRYLPNMLKVGAIKWKRHKSSRFLPEFNAKTNALIAEEKAKKAADAAAIAMVERLQGGGL